MPITLTLTDDQALDIVSQVSAILSNRPNSLSAGEPIKVDINPENKPAKMRRRAHRSSFKDRQVIFDEVGKFKSGATFSPRTIYRAMGNNNIRPWNVRDAFKTLKHKNIISSVSRGLWKKN